MKVEVGQIWESNNFELKILHICPHVDEQPLIWYIITKCNIPNENPDNYVGLILDKPLRYFLMNFSRNTNVCSDS